MLRQNNNLIPLGRPMATAEIRLYCTSFKNARNPQGGRFSCTWDRLVERIKEPRVLSWGDPTDDELFELKKTKLRGWNIATFEGDYRSKERFLSAGALGFDLDRFADLEGIKERLSSFVGVVHTSIKHTPESPRCRVFLPLSRPVSAEEYARLWAELAPTVGNVDQAAKDPSRLWFQPCVIEGREYLAFELGNGLIDVDQTLARLPKPEAPSPAESRPPPRLHVARTALVERAKRWLEKADPAISGSGGQAQTWRVCLALVKGFGLESSTALELLTPWNARCQPPWRTSELKRQLERAESESTTASGYLLDRGAA